MLPEAGVVLAARDGAVIADIEDQLRLAEGSATHLVVSIGGNDAIRASGVIDRDAANVAAALDRLAAVGEQFGRAYAEMVGVVVGRALPTAFCTIYEPPFPDQQRRRAARTALTVLNDVITREVFRAGASLIDLRLVCDRDEDFANPIEPSSMGGEKIARAIARFARNERPMSKVFG